jgi:hypothetical protein
LKNGSLTSENAIPSSPSMSPDSLSAPSSTSRPSDKSVESSKPDDRPSQAVGDITILQARIKR